MAENTLGLGVLETEIINILQETYLLYNLPSKFSDINDEVLMFTYVHLLCTYDCINQLPVSEYKSIHHCELNMENLKHIIRCLRPLGLSYLAPKPKDLLDRKRASKIILALHDKVSSKHGKSISQRVRMVIKKIDLIIKSNQKANFNRPGTVSCGKTIDKTENENSDIVKEEILSQDASLCPHQEEHFVTPAPIPPPLAKKRIIPGGWQIPRTPIKENSRDTSKYENLPLRNVPNENPPLIDAPMYENHPLRDALKYKNPPFIPPPPSPFQDSPIVQKAEKKQFTDTSFKAISNLILTPPTQFSACGKGKSSNDEVPSTYTLTDKIETIKENCGPDPVPGNSVSQLTNPSPPQQLPPEQPSPPPPSVPKEMKRRVQAPKLGHDKRRTYIIGKSEEVRVNEADSSAEDKNMKDKRRTYYITKSNPIGNTSMDTFEAMMIQSELDGPTPSNQSRIISENVCNSLSIKEEFASCDGGLSLDNSVANQDCRRLSYIDALNLEESLYDSFGGKIPKGLHELPRTPPSLDHSLANGSSNPVSESTLVNTPVRLSYPQSNTDQLSKSINNDTFDKSFSRIPFIASIDSSDDSLTIFTSKNRYTKCKEIEKRAAGKHALDKTELTKQNNEIKKMPVNEFEAALNEKESNLNVAKRRMRNQTFTCSPRETADAHEVGNDSDITKRNSQNLKNSKKELADDLVKEIPLSRTKSRAKDIVNKISNKQSCKIKENYIETELNNCIAGMKIKPKVSSKQKSKTENINDDVKMDEGKVRRGRRKLAVHGSVVDMTTYAHQNRIQEEEKIDKIPTMENNDNSVGKKTNKKKEIPTIDNNDDSVGKKTNKKTKVQTMEDNDDSLGKKTNKRTFRTRNVKVENDSIQEHESKLVATMNDVGIANKLVTHSKETETCPEKCEENEIKSVKTEEVKQGNDSIKDIETEPTKCISKPSDVICKNNLPKPKTKLKSTIGNKYKESSEVESGQEEVSEGKSIVTVKPKETSEKPKSQQKTDNSKPQNDVLIKDGENDTVKQVEISHVLEKEVVNEITAKVRRQEMTTKAEVDRSKLKQPQTEALVNEDPASIKKETGVGKRSKKLNIKKTESVALEMKTAENENVRERNEIKAKSAKGIERETEKLDHKSEMGAKSTKLKRIGKQDLIDSLTHHVNEEESDKENEKKSGQITTIQVREKVDKLKRITIQPQMQVRENGGTIDIQKPLTKSKLKQTLSLLSQKMERDCRIEEIVEDKVGKLMSTERSTTTRRKKQSKVTSEFEHSNDEKPKKPKKSANLKPSKLGPAEADVPNFEQTSPQSRNPLKEISSRPSRRCKTTALNAISEQLNDTD